MPGTSKAEGGKEEHDDEDGLRRVETEVMNAVFTASLVDSTTRAFWLERQRRWVLLKEAQVVFWLWSLFST